jgi:hypothetical protein
MRNADFDFLFGWSAGGLLLLKISNSSVLNRWRVAGVSGSAMIRASSPEARKVCRLAFVVPEYHARGTVPSGSPVPGTM